MQTRFDRQERLFQAIRLICRIDLDVARVAQGLLCDTELTPAKHRILEVLAEGEPLTVAGAARRLSLKRQFMQRMIAELVACGLVETMENPAHSRSFHCRPSARGHALLTDLRMRESAMLNRHLGDLNTTEVIVALRVLNRVSACYSELARDGLGAAGNPVSGSGGDLD